MSLISDRTFGLLVIASVVYYVLAVFAMHLLQPELDPLRVPMSPYVLGRYGPLMTTTFFVLCAGLGSLMALPAMAIAPGLFSLDFRRDEYWRSVSVVALALSAGVVAAFIVGGFADALWGFGGLAQRFFFAVLFAWMILVGRHLTRATRVR